MAIEDQVEQVLKESSPKADAVKALIDVKKRVVGEDSDVEVKTDLTRDDVSVHSLLDTMSNILEMTPQQFNSKCILAELVHKKERKLISKDRMSRREIVDVARNPDQQILAGTQGQDQSFLKRFFTSRKNVQ